MKKILFLAILYVGILVLGERRVATIFCYFGNGELCYSVGYYYHTGEENTKINLEKAKKYYKKSCEKGISEGCHNLGLFAQEEQKILEAREYFKKGCDLNFAKSCVGLGYSYFQYEPKDIQKSIQTLEIACDKFNESNSCGLTGLTYLGLNDFIDKNKGKIYLTKSCDLDHNISCNVLGRFYSYDEKDYKKGNEYYKKACDLNNSSACNSIGFHYENGYGFEVNLKEAHKYYKKACENLKDDYGCGSLGYLYLVAKSADDFSNSPEFYEKSCKFNDGENCANLENFLKNYDFIDRDYKKAKELLEYSCDEKVPQSCGVLGTMYEFGKGVSQDIFVAKENYKKACDLNYKFGCDELKRLENN